MPTPRMAVVTGAGSGAGRAIAIALAEAGWNLTLIGRRRSALLETKMAIEADTGVRCLAAVADVGDEVAVSGAVEESLQSFGRIDALICAAGVGIYGPVEETSVTAWNETLSTNLTGAFLASKGVLPTMRRQHSGAIIALASGAGKQGFAGMTAYSASKFGLMGFMEALAAEVGKDGIKVSTIVPGSILTDFGGRTVEMKQLGDASKRYLTPDDVANAVLFLLGQDEHAWTQELNLWPF